MDTIVSGAYYVHFNHGDAQYRLYASPVPVVLGEPATWLGSLSVWDESLGQFTTVASVSAEPAPGSTIQWEVPRQIIPNEVGVSPQRGAVIDGLWAETSLFRNDPTGVHWTDRMPDQGKSEAEWVFQYGLQQTGHARLSSQDAVKISNGAATTHLFTLQASNTGESQDTFTLTIHDVPGSWTAPRGRNPT